MDAPERFRAICDFRPVDRLPVMEWAGYWKKTTEHWLEEGLPEAVLRDGKPVPELIAKYLDLDLFRAVRLFPITSETRQDMAEILGKPYVECDADYEKLLPHLYPPFDIPDAMGELVARRDAGELVFRCELYGYFWWPRVLFGIEQHFYAFYDHPELMERMNRDLTEYNLKLVREIREFCKPDVMAIREDMSYNHGPMLSRDIFDRSMRPHYLRLTEAMRALDAPILVDSDGDVTELAGWLLDAGVDGIFPLEKQAGTDLAELRRRHPGILLLGAFDKTVMDKGEAAIRAEFERLLPVARQGGFIISVDHQTPPIPWADYELFVALFKEYAQKAAMREDSA